MTTKESREISGEVEGWSNEVREFGKNNRGSRGIKVEGDWHNIVGRVNELEKIDTSFPKGSYVKFKESKNNRGYWDVDGDLVVIKKEEVEHEPAEPENQPEQTKEQTPQQAQQTKTQTVENNAQKNKQIQYQVCLKAAVELMKIFYQGQEVVDRDELGKNTLIATTNLYKGMNEKRLELMENGTW